MKDIRLESNIIASAVFFVITFSVCTVLIFNIDREAVVSYVLITFMWVAAYVVIYKSATNIYISKGTIRTYNYLALFDKRFEYSLKDIEKFKCYYSGGIYAVEAVIIYFKDGTKKKFKVSVPIKKLKEFSEKLRGLGFEVEYFD